MTRQQSNFTDHQLTLIIYNITHIPLPRYICEITSKRFLTHTRGQVHLWTIYIYINARIIRACVSRFFREHRARVRIYTIEVARSSSLALKAGFVIFNLQYGTFRICRCKIPAKIGGSLSIFKAISKRADFFTLIIVYYAYTARRII